jgi:hypothetical protein
MSEHTWKLINNLLNAMEKVKDFHMRYPNMLKVASYGTCH